MTRTDGSGPIDWGQLEALWDAVHELPPDARDAFLASRAADGALREELRSLLARADSAEAFFDRLSAVVPHPGESMTIEDRESKADSGGSPDGPAGAELDPLIGTTVGHYEIVGRLGQGGMGIVYRATDLRLRRTVALKLLRARPVEDLRAKERLLVEARAAAALDHANICTIYEVGETSGGSAYIAMAYYPGETLEQVMQRGPLPLAAALDYATQIARGLGAAHARGIVHRDVKPANVIITDGGVPKLLDFGIARIPDVEVSRDGVTPGTIAYMSPEQVTSRRVDVRADLWSLGVVLYEMCAGERPFDGESAGAVLYAILQHAPRPPSSVRPELPERVDAIVARLLAKDPEQRYPDAVALVADLATADVRTPPMRAAPRGDTPEWTDREPAGGDRGEPVRSAGASVGSRGPWRRRVAWGVAALAVTTGIVSWPLAVRFAAGDERVTARDAPAPTGVVPSIAVLPVRTAPADSLDALAEAMTAELTSILGREPGKLRAISSTAAARFRDREVGHRAIAESLGVAAVLESHLQRVGERVRLSVQLIEGNDGSLRWSETYTDEYHELFAEQESVARSVARVLNVALRDVRGTGEFATRVENGAASDRRIEAIDYHVEGRRAFLFRTDAGRRQARALFQRALEADSTYAPAHASMALSLFTGEWEPGMVQRAAEHARAAMRLDSLLADAHAAVGRVLTHEYRFAEAEGHLRRAIELDPTRPNLRDFLIWLYVFMDRSRDALEQARLSLLLDPNRPNGIAEMARAHLLNGRCDEALVQLGRLHQMQPPPARALGIEAQCYAERRMWPQALEAVQRLAGTNAQASPWLGFVLARAGRVDEAKSVRDSILARWRRRETGAYGLAVIHVGLGDLDRAFSWLDRAYDDRSLRPEIMEPMLGELHRDARFDRFREKLGLQPTLSPGRILAKDLYDQAVRDVLFRTDSGRRVTRELVRRALAADSTFAPAHAARALGAIVQGEHHRQSIAEAERHARTAIRLDSLLPDGHAALGRVFMVDYRFQDAEAHLRRAIELDPKSQRREFLIWLYVFVGRPRDALEQAKEFVRHNPTASNAIAELAHGYLANGRCDDALRELERLRVMQPPPARVGSFAAQCHAVRKEWPQAIAAIRRVAETNEEALGFLGFMLARGGGADSARAILDTLLARYQRGDVTAWGPAVVHAGLGDLDQAFHWLDRSYEDRSLRDAIMEPMFEDLHRDPRFDRLRRKLGIQKR